MIMDEPEDGQALQHVIQAAQSITRTHLLSICDISEVRCQLRVQTMLQDDTHTNAACPP